MDQESKKINNYTKFVGIKTGGIYECKILGTIIGIK
jgi:hypothetical protein